MVFMRASAARIFFLGTRFAFLRRVQKRFAVVQLFLTKFVEESNLIAARFAILSERAGHKKHVFALLVGDSAEGVRVLYLAGIEQ